MGKQSHKTEHAGAKHGRGAYYGPKHRAKRDSNVLRRQADKRAVVEGKRELARRKG